MSRPRVFVTRRIPAAGLDRIVAACEAAVWEDPLPPPRGGAARRVAGCEGLVTLLTDRVDAELLDAAGPQLKVISNFAVGFNNIDVAEASRRRIRIGNTPDVLTEATADMAFALLIRPPAGSCKARTTSATRSGKRGSRWGTSALTWWVGRQASSAWAGSARRWPGGATAGGTWHRIPLPGEPSARGAGAVLPRVYWETLLEGVRFRSVHTDSNASTRGMFDREVFCWMKPTAVFAEHGPGPYRRGSRPAPGDEGKAGSSPRGWT